jgi:hypothetical protein
LVGIVLRGHFRQYHRDVHRNPKFENLMMVGKAILGKKIPGSLEAEA